MTDRPHPIHLVDEPPDDEHPTLPSEPHDDAAERAVLGGMLLSRQAIADCVEVLRPADFYRPAHEGIYDATVHLYSCGEPSDAITVSDELAKRGALTRFGGQVYLHQLISAVPTAANAGYYAQIVAERAVLRRLVQAGGKILQLGYAQGGGSVADLVATAQQEVLTITPPHSDELAHDQAVYAAVEDLEASPGLPTPWAHLTEAIAGWKPACLYLIGARPAIGKSVVGVGIAMDAARRGKTALVYSLEMSRTEVYHRMIGSVGNINMAKIQHRNLATADWPSVSTAAAHIAALPLHVDDRAALSLTQIRTSVITEQRKHDVGVVIIDYLQLLTPPMAGHKDDRRVQVDSISRGLKALAKDCNIPVIALTQLNRGVESRADKTPTLADLREAGGQEQDADVVLLLHRDLKETPTELKVSVAKNRHGAQAAFELLFRGEFSRIDDQPWTPSSALGRTP